MLCEVYSFKQIYNFTSSINVMSKSALCCFCDTVDGLSVAELLLGLCCCWTGCCSTVVVVLLCNTSRLTAYCPRFLFDHNLASDFEGTLSKMFSSYEMLILLSESILPHCKFQEKLAIYLQLQDIVNISCSYLRPSLLSQNYSCTYQEYNFFKLSVQCFLTMCSYCNSCSY